MKRNGKRTELMTRLLTVAEAARRDRQKAQGLYMQLLGKRLTAQQAEQQLPEEWQARYK